MNTNKKLENIMLTTSKPTADNSGALVKLIDFGLSSWINKSEKLVGTCEYFSPELAYIKLKTLGPYFDNNCKASDVYALGVVFTWLLSGRSLFSYATNNYDAADVLELILHRNFTIPASIYTFYQETFPLIYSMLELEEKRCSITDVVDSIENLSLYAQVEGRSSKRRKPNLKTF